MRRVHPAQPYNFNRLRPSSHENDFASCMLISQCAFPDTFDETLDVLQHVDHDRLPPRDLDDIFQRHLANTIGQFEDRIRQLDPEQVIAFIRELQSLMPSFGERYPEDPPKGLKWTGYRICGSVHHQTMWPVWGFELFAKHPKSTTLIYSSHHAPNVEGFEERELERMQYEMKMLGYYFERPLV